MKIIIDILGKEINVKEPSYNDYKKLLKNLTTNENVSKVFNDFIYDCTGNSSFNILEKFILLLNLRGLILGNTYEVEYEEKNYSLDIDDILLEFDKKYELTILDINGNQYGFDYVNDFEISDNKITFIADSLKVINGKVLELDRLEKESILPALNFNNIYENLIEKLYQTKVNINFLNEDIHLFNCLYFLKGIFNTDLLELYKLEYVCRKRLNFNSLDFDKCSLPECRILLNYHVEEVKKENDNAEQLSNRNR